MTATLATVAYIYKKLYSTKQIADLTTRDHVWWAMIHKEDGFTGKSFSYTLPYAAPQGVSGDFTKSRTNAKPSSGAQPEAYRTPKFGTIKLNSEAVQAARGDKGAFFNLVTRETDSILSEMGDAYAFDFQRDTYGMRGQIASISGNDLTLTDASHGRNFKVNMTIAADDSATGASPRSGTTYVTAVRITPTTAVITVNSAAAITGLQANDYLFRDGDPGTCMEGLEVCTPLSAPVLGADSWRGIDRGAHPDLLAGSRIDDTSLNAEVALGLLAVQISLNGRTHHVDQAFLHPTQFFNFTQRLGAKVEYDDGGGTANVGFQYAMIHTSAGSFRVYADPDTRFDRGRVTREGTQYVKHMGGLPHIFDLDGNTTLRMTDENNIETRAEGYCNLIQDDPAAQGVCSLSTT